MKVFINLSNHPSDKWSAVQRNAAQCYGRIVDIRFPQIEPDADSKAIDELVKEYLERLSCYEIAAVMLQGEFVFTYRLVSELKRRNITVLSACARRVALESFSDSGTTLRESEFAFVQFREY